MILLASCGGGEGSAGSTSVTPAATPSPSPSPSPSSLSATAFAAQMAPGWNLGNTLEAIGNGGTPAATSQETAWGNPAASQAMMDAVAAAGFKSVRIPVSWAQYADSSDTISTAWLNRVAQVVDYARKAKLFVIINVHWDGGWLQPTFAQRDAANARLAKFWTQIATRFKDYDDHLLFAGTNEVMVTGNYNAPTTENCTVQNGFNKVFVDTVRTTGGVNAARYLVVQGYNTNIDYTLSCNATLPADTATDKLMMEVHYYDPYNFTLNENSNIWQWGATATDPTVTENWANEAHVDSQFAKLKAMFAAKGVPVILGEYGAIMNTEYDPTGKYRTLWDGYVTKAAHTNGMVPIYWDNGYTGNHALGLFDRSKATVQYQPVVDAIVAGAR